MNKPKDLTFSANVLRDEQNPIDCENLVISFQALSSNPTIKREGLFEDYYISIDTDKVKWKAKNLFLDHNPTFNNSVGVIEDVKKDSDGFKVKVKFFENIPASKEAFERYKAGLSNSVSVGFGEAFIEEVGKINNLAHYKIKSGEIIELSAVWLGADPRAVVSKFSKKEILDSNSNQQGDLTMNSEQRTQEKQATSLATQAANQENHSNQKQGNPTMNQENLSKTNAINDAKEIAQLSEVVGQKELGLKAIAEGLSFEEFRKTLYEQSTQENKSFAIKTSQKSPSDEFSLYNIISNNPSSSEMDFYDRTRGKFKIPNKFYKKFDSTATDVITKSTNSGVQSIEPTYYRGDKFIDLLRMQSPLLQKLDLMSGLTSIQQIPRDNTKLTATFLDEGATSNAQSLEFDHITLTPKTISNKVIITRRMFQMSPIALESFVITKMIEGIKDKLESVLLYGKAPEPITGIFNTNGIQVVPDFMKKPDFTSVLRFKGLLQSKNYSTSNCAFFVNTLGFTKLEGTAKSVEGNPIDLNKGGADKLTQNIIVSKEALLQNNQMAGFEVFANNLMKDGDIILGDFSNAILGTWSDGIEIVSYKEQGDNLIIEGFYDVDIVLKRNDAFVISKA